MEHKIFNLDLHGQTETFEFGKMAKQADGSVVLKCGDTVMVAAISADENAPADEDFLPLTVNYIEKTYAAGKIPGGFFKREAKPSEFETLTSRIIDRTIRPLFPKGFNYPVVLTVMVLSADDNADLQRLALLAANGALFTSPLPIDKNVAGVRIARVNGEYKVNPTLKEMKESTLDLLVAGSAEELLMIEMQALANTNVAPVEELAVDPAMGNITPELLEQSDVEMSEDELAEAIALAGEALKVSCTQYNENFVQCVKPKKEYPLLESVVDESIVEYIERVELDSVKEAVAHMARTERSSHLLNIAKRVQRSNEEWEMDNISKAIEKVKKSVVRSGILDNNLRADGRKPNEIREITIDTNLLPKAHGSVLFTRGQTQALVVATLGGDTDRQMSESLTSKQPLQDNFMLHYNFHGFCVNEAKPPRGASRRELGHGNLARRALECMLPANYDNTVRVVSEILESNGSSSMATVCGGSLSLKAATVPVKKLVAGVAMGLVTDGEKEVVLSDITGLEDHDGDMDFKVAGTRDGITAMQMDIKLGGISEDLLKNALAQANEARNHILGLMEEADANIVINESALPKTEIFSVSTDKIVDIIGQAGKTIRELIETFEVSIDLDRDKGGVKVRGDDSGLVDAAVAKIKEIVSKDNGRGRGGPRGGRDGGRGGQRRRENTPTINEKGDVLPGKIQKILEFGMLVEMPDENVGMVHISKIGKGRISNIGQYFKEGENVDIIFLAQDEKTKKIELELKDKIEG